MRSIADRELLDIDGTGIAVVRRTEQGRVARESYGDAKVVVCRCVRRADLRLLRPWPLDGREHETATVGALAAYGLQAGPDQGRVTVERHSVTIVVVGDGVRVTQL